MNIRGLALLFVGGLGLFGCVSCLSAGCAVTNSPPTWATVQEQTIPPEAAGAMKDVVQKLYQAQRAHDREAVLALIDPDDADSFWVKLFLDTARFAVTVDSVAEPYLLSPDWAVVEVPQTMTWSNGARQQSTGRWYFRVSDQEHKAWNLGIPDYNRMGWPIAAPLEVGPRSPGRLPTDPMYADTATAMCAAYSKQWPGWSPDRDKCVAAVKEWWEEQENQFGRLGFSARPSGRFVGQDEKGAAIVEMGFVFGDPKTGRSAVAYRYRMVQEDASFQYPASMEKLTGGDWKWRIADICVWKVEKLPAEEPASGGTSSPPAAQGAPAAPYAH